MRSPFDSEQEAFRFLLAGIVALAAIAASVALGPSWLPYVLIALIALGVGARAVQLRMRALRGLVLPVKMAPPHVGSPQERRVLVVANDVLGEDAMLTELRRLAADPHTHVRVLAPAIVSGAARLAGAFQGPMDEARERVRNVLESVGHERVLGGEITEAKPLQAVEDAFATFTPDEVIVATDWEGAEDKLEPHLAPLVRERFAVPVRHLVIAPGAPAREPSLDTEFRYRRESGDYAAKRLALRALAGAGIAAAVVMSSVALIHSSEKDEARAASRAQQEQIAQLPPVPGSVSLKVLAGYKPGPEGEKHDAFTITDFNVRAGQAQKLVIDNTDDVPHSITSPTAGVNITIMPGVHSYTLYVKNPGRYLWFCTWVCDEWAMEHPGYMSGYLNVS